MPLDYARPGGRKITLALTEVSATAPASQRLGILLVNPGGPGASGTAWASYVARITRASMLEVIRTDYIRTAWAKGCEPRS